MSRTITPLQMNIVGDDGEVKGQYSPETYAETVTTGSVKKSESLELPGTDPSETLTDTIAKVKLYLDNVSSIASEKREVVDSPDDNSSNIPSTRATASLKASLDAINAIVTKNKEDIATKAPITHADAEKTYGGGTEDLYGHVKTTDKYVYTNEDETAPTAADSVAASPKAVADAYTTLDTAKAPVSHASTDTKYGSASLIDYGHVKASDTYKVAIEDGDAEHGVVASQKAVNDMYKDLSSNQETGIVSRAPIMHADAERTYGAGTESLYGHVKISDNYDMEDVETKGNAANGMAASLFALHRSNAALQAVVDTKLPSTHAAEKATAEKFSHVKLTDNYQTSQGSAADGVGASSKALADSFAKLNASIITAQNSITSLNSDIAAHSNRINDAYNIATTAKNRSDIQDLLLKADSIGYTDATVVNRTYNGDGTNYKTYICPTHMLHLGEEYLLKVNTGAIYKAIPARARDNGEFIWDYIELLLGSDIPTGTTGTYGKGWDNNGGRYSAPDGAPIALFSGCGDHIVRAWFCRINGTRV